MVDRNRMGGNPGRDPRRGPRRFGKRPLKVRNPNSLTLKKLDGNRYVFTPPRCAVDRDLDLEEVADMRGEGELDVARDELLFLVEDCRGFLEAYNLLAELALEAGDIPLARGHYGFGYESGLEALPSGFQGIIPSEEGYNPHFFTAGRGLARCLIAMQEVQKGREVLAQLLKFDPRDADTLALLADVDENFGPDGKRRELPK